MNKTLRLKAYAFLADIEDESLLLESMSPSEVKDYLLHEAQEIMYEILQDQRRGDLEK